MLEQASNIPSCNDTEQPQKPFIFAISKMDLRRTRVSKHELLVFVQILGFRAGKKTERCDRTPASRERNLKLSFLIKRLV